MAEEAAPPAPAESDDRRGDPAATTKIVNWSGTHSVELRADDYREPETRDELSLLVDGAYRRAPGFPTHVRPVGSALSPNGLSFDGRGMVCLSNLDRVLRVDERDMTVTVEAGTRVSSVLGALRPHGLTLPNLASIAEQQVGGFVSAGAHGTGAAIPPVDMFVEALTIVTPSRFGTVRMTEESHGEAFRLARLGLGGLGVLSEVTLRCVPSHRLVETTTVATRAEAREKLPTLLKRHRHVRYMWIPYEDAVVVVTNDPEDDLPLAMEGGVVVDDGKGGKRKVVTARDVAPTFSRDERLAPLRDLLRKLLLEYQRGSASSSSSPLDDGTIDGMGFGDLRDAVLASGNMLNPDHVRRVNRAEREFWDRSQGMEIAPSDQKLQFDCGGQQWVYEVCFPAGTYGLPNSNSADFVEELLAEVESRGIAAPSPIEQRWTSASTSPLSPAYAGGGGRSGYDARHALFSWVGVIMYLPSEDLDPTGYRREFVTQSFKDGYCRMVREVGERYGAMCHWAKLELGDDEEDGGGGAVAGGVRERLGPRVVGAFNEARATYDPKGVLSCSLIDRIFGPSPSND
jgi:L-galactono-1,4-lactone dehydrogenase